MCLSDGQFDGDFRQVLVATKGTSKAKQLSSMIIPKYFKHFPELAEQATNALMDLCEDEELSVRWLIVLQCSVFFVDTSLRYSCYSNDLP